MRMSCNGCRVLRKGCRRNCIIRPCLKWIKNPESQANATLFLSKFYGRAGLLNLINSGPEHLRPAMFRSLLYEACGRMVNPIYGSVGLMWTGKWSLCEAEVTAVLDGAPINKTLLDKACSIRHKDPSANHDIGAKRRTRVRRSVAGVKPEIFSITENTGREPSAEMTVDCLERSSGARACIDLALGLAPPTAIEAGHEKI